MDKGKEVPAVLMGDLVNSVAADTGLLKGDVRRVLRAFVRELGVALGRGGQVRVTGLGIFEVTEYPPRMGVHPQTGEPLEQAACKAPRFRASRTLKERVRGGM